MSTKSKLLESSSEEERKNIISEYNDWVWNFPKGYIDKIQQHVKESQMKRQMKKRQKEDNEMPDDE